MQIANFVDYTYNLPLSLVILTMFLCLTLFKTQYIVSRQHEPNVFSPRLSFCHSLRLCYIFNILIKIRLNCKSYLKIVAKSE